MYRILTDRNTEKAQKRHTRLVLFAIAFYATQSTKILVLLKGQ